MSGEKRYIWRCSHPDCDETARPGDSLWRGGPQHLHRSICGPLKWFDAEKVEVTPVDAPNVLTVEEAEIVVDRLGVGRTPEELVGGRLLWGRLSTWVEEQIDPDLTDDDIADAVGRGILSVEDEAPDA